jgi:hypothetical protein
VFVDYTNHVCGILLVLSNFVDYILFFIIHHPPAHSSFQGSPGPEVRSNNSVARPWQGRVEKHVSTPVTLTCHGNLDYNPASMTGEIGHRSL